MYVPRVQARSQNFASGGAHIFLLGHQFLAGPQTPPLPWKRGPGFSQKYVKFYIFGLELVYYQAASATVMECCSNLQLNMPWFSGEKNLNKFLPV